MRTNKITGKGSLTCIFLLWMNTPRLVDIELSENFVNCHTSDQPATSNQQPATSNQQPINLTQKS